MCLFERRWFGRIPVLWAGYGVGFIFWERGSCVLPLPSSSTASGPKGGVAPRGPGRPAFHSGFLHGHLLSSSHKFFRGSRLVVWLLPDTRLVAQRESPGPMHFPSLFLQPARYLLFCLIQLCLGVGIFCPVLVSWQGALLVLYIVGCPDAKPSPTEERKGSCVVTTAWQFSRWK